jgi:hypothetical protein
LQRGLPIAVAVSAIGLNAYVWDAFHPANPLTRMEQRLGTNTPDVVAAGCDLIVGDYWKAWPAMLAVNDYYYRNNILDPKTQRPRRVYAITSLAASIEHLWRPILERPDTRVCSLYGDEAGYRRSLNAYTPEIALQMMQVEQFGRVIVYQVQHSPLKLVDFDFEIPPPGQGWSVEAAYPSGVTFEWMDSTQATILLPLSNDCDMRIEFRVLYAMAPDILESLTLRVNNRPIQLSTTKDREGGTVFQGVIPQSTLEANSNYTLLSFHISRLLIPQFVLQNSNDARTLGLAFDWLRIQRQP